MPPSLRDWLPEDHLAWFVIEAVRGWIWRRSMRRIARMVMGGAAYDPAMMVALLLYAYSREVRSSRGSSVLSAGHRLSGDRGNRVPDHATIARFMVRHEAALAELFSAVLGLCA